MKIERDNYDDFVSKECVFVVIDDKDGIKQKKEKKKEQSMSRGALN